MVTERPVLGSKIVMAVPLCDLKGERVAERLVSSQRLTLQGMVRAPLLVEAHQRRRSPTRR